MHLSDGDLEALEYRAVFSYHSTTEGDLVFGEGDPVLVYWAQDNGWWYGTSGGREPGWFPGSYVEVRAENHGGWGGGGGVPWPYVEVRAENYGGWGGEEGGEEGGGGGGGGGGDGFQGHMWR